MKSITFIILVIVLIVGMGVASPAHASPAAPTFFEGIKEWFGDVLTFGDLAKAERDIKKAEAIFQYLSDNLPKDSSIDTFLKKGLIRYQERMLNTQLHFENAKQKGKDISSLGKTITDVTDRHIGVLETSKEQWGDKADGIGLLRALEVVKDANTHAREAIGQALEKKGETEVMPQKTTIPEPPVQVEKQTPSENVRPPVGVQKKIETSSSASSALVPHVVSIEVFPAANNQTTGRKQIEVRCRATSEDKPIGNMSIYLYYPGYKPPSDTKWMRPVTALDASNSKDQIWTASFDIETPSILEFPKYPVDGVYTSSCTAFVAGDNNPLQYQSTVYYKTFTLP